MPFRVRTDTRPVGPQSHPVTVLEAGGGSARAELWPTLGGNCLAWQVAHGGRTLDLLYAPECRSLWPADYRLTLTWTLSARALTLHAAVQNPDRVPLPFGLGFHPYFRVPADGTATMQATARRRWELADSLPTGRLLDL